MVGSPQLCQQSPFTACPAVIIAHLHSRLSRSAPTEKERERRSAGPEQIRGKGEREGRETLGVLRERGKVQGGNVGGEKGRKGGLLQVT